MIVQMQGSKAGQYELQFVERVTHGMVYLQHPLIHSYRSAGADTAQIVRVVQYHMLTVARGGSLRSQHWNGQVGGVLSLRADTLVVESGGQIDASGQGFRGGPSKERGHWIGHAGESWTQTGFPKYGNTNNNGGAGGSSFCSCGEAAGGDSYGTVGLLPSGQSCSKQPHGKNGAVYGSDQLTRLFLGSGGGGGCRDDGTCEYPPGASGGGLIYIIAATAVIEGSVKSRGGSPTGGYHSTCDDTIGGPGSGGSLYIQARQMTVTHPTAAFDVDGGERVYVTQPAIYTGTGGKGRVRVDFKLLNGHEHGTLGATKEESRFISVGYWGVIV